MNVFTEGLYDRMRRPPREPLRQLDELAEEFGVPHRTLIGLIATLHGPKPRISGRRNFTSNKNYYSPSEMRAWWKQVKP